MDLPRFGGGSGNGMLNGIKSKLGFAEDPGYDEYYDEDYEEYDDAVDGAGASEDTYSSYAPVTTRSAGARRPSRTSYSDRAASTYGERRNSTHPPLVSFDDVRANTSVPDSLRRDPLPARPRGGFAARNVVGHANEFALSGSEVEGGYGSATEEDAAADGASNDTSGFTSAFSDVPPQPGASVGVVPRSNKKSSYDPYSAYEGSGDYSHKPTRGLSVLTPQNYSEVESIARSLKAGDAVVLSLKATPSQLSKRVLDFAFGVASALDASVDCEADKVFVVTRNGALSEDERNNLRTKGVL